MPTRDQGPRDLAELAERQPRLGALMRAYWDRPIREFARQAFEAPPGTAFEDAFRRALRAELAPRVGTGVDALIARVERSGAIVTAHHVCPTNGPTFGAVDQLATLGQPGPILVLAWSGIAMSNRAASGALCFAAAQWTDLLQPGSRELAVQLTAAESRARDGVVERRLTLIPSAWRDALVYECPLPARVQSVRSAATVLLQPWLFEPQPDERYPAWALRVNERIQRHVFGRDDLWYVDLNRVARTYMIEVLSDPEHALSKLLCSSVGHAVTARLPEMPWFYVRGQRAQRGTVTALVGPVAAARERLISGELCPGLLPVFGALRLLSRMRLLGGLRQVEYIESIARAWLDAGVLRDDPGLPGGLLTGRWSTHAGPLYPLDIALDGALRAQLPDETAAMSTLWEPLFESIRGRA